VDRIPAICGGAPAFADGPPAWPRQTPEVLEALQAAYRSGAWGRYLGPHCEALVERISQDLQTPHVRLCSSGTVAVELALRGLGIEPGDEVLIAAYDFPGNFRAIAAAGATPVVVDVDVDTFGIDVRQIEQACGPKTRAVIASHLHGGLVDMPALVDIARGSELGVVEDACQAAGATVYGRPAGAWGDVGTFSFGGSKLLTAGRGGAVIAQSPAVMQRMKVFSEQGNDAYPLSELQAAVLLPQCDSLPQDHARRESSARALSESLSRHPAFRLPKTPDARNSPPYYKLGILLDHAKLGGATRDDFCRAARAEGIALDPGFRGFLRRGPTRCRQASVLTGAEQVVDEVAVLHHPVLLESEAIVHRVGEVLQHLATCFASGAVRLPQTEANEP
jgi:perosamine synthetase